MQDVSFLQALIITFISIIVVVLVLAIISYAIGILKSFSKSDYEEEQLDTNIVEKPKEETNDDELVAVIAAALAASMGLEIPHIRINRIKKLENSTWNNAAKLEQIN